MAENNLNIISGSKYNIYDKFMAIAEHYFGTNTDYLKSGFMSYATECMALIMRDSSIHKSMLYNESFLNTAIMPKSIYNWAKMFNIDIGRAKPAFADVMITINVNELENMYRKKKCSQDSVEKFGSDVTSRGEKNIFIIDRSNPLVAGSYMFSLEKSILIYKSDDNQSSYSWIVQYCTTEEPDTTNYGNNDEKFLKTVITTTNGEQYLSFIVRLWQYQVTTIQKQITSSSFTDTKIHVFEFPNQIAGLRLQYKKNNLTQHIPLVFADSIKNENSLYAYYNIIEDNKVQIKFLNDVFLPSVGGTLIVDLYTTLGSAGNYTFKSDLVFSLNDEDYRSLAVSATFVDYQSYGGVDSPSLSQIKSTIISDISSRNIIVTESDLNQYFFKLASLLESINDGKVEFIKKRDDIIKRTFNAYLLLRTGVNAYGESNIGSGYRSAVIPTNTIDVTFPVTGNCSKAFGSIVEETPNINNVENTDIVTYKLVKDEDVPTAETVANTDYYVIPFYMRVLLDPIKKVKYIYNAANDSTSLKYINIKSSGSNSIMTPSSVAIKREMSGANVSDSYQIEFTFATSFKFNEGMLKNCKLRIYRNESIYTTIVYNNVTWSVTSNITGDDENIYKTIITINLEVDGDNEFNFSTLDDYGMYVHLADGLQLQENTSFGLDVNFSISGDTFDFTVKSDRDLGVFRSLDSIMSSDIILNKTTDDADVTSISSITIKEVPVVHASFFNTESNKTKFVKQLFTYIDLLKENISVLETNTFFNLKFMNTFGRSQLYDTQTTNIDLELTIYLKSSVEERDALAKEIRDYVRVVIDKYNNDSIMSVSNVITLVTAAYSNVIDHIVFEGLNGTFGQYIQTIQTANSKEYVPEYFNLDATKLASSIKFK